MMSVRSFRAGRGALTRAALSSLGLSVLLGCANRLDEADTERNNQIIVSSPEAPSSDLLSEDTQDNDSTQTQSTERWYRRAPSLSVGATESTYQTETLRLEFVDANVNHVVRTVIGQALGETVVIGSGVSGTVTLSSPGPVPTSEALDALGQALRASGLALTRTSSGYLLENDQNNRRGPNAAQDFDARTDLFPVRNTSPSLLLAMAEPFMPENIEAAADDDRRVIVLSGPVSQVEDFATTLRRFDLPQLSDRVFGLVEIRFAAVDELASELSPLLEETLGSAFDLTTLIPLPRLNQMFVSTATNDQFNQIQAWIERLDRQALGDEAQLYYYVAQNAPAADLAAQVDAVFSGVVARDPSRSFLPTLGTGTQLGTPGGTIASPAIPRITPNVFGTNRDFSIVPDELNNALIIRATGTEYRDILTLLKRMDVLPKQVLIEVTIAEVTLNEDLQFGVRWFFSEGDFSGFFPDFVGSTDGVANFPAVTPSLSATYIDGLSIGAALNLLETVTDISVISTPSILVQNNQTANLQVGDQIPVVTQQSQSVDTGNAPVLRSIQQRDTGVILQVEPRISGTNSVVLNIDQEVSDSIPTTTSDIDSPTIRQRQFSSTVAVESGATIVLGGLISDSTTGNRTSVPFLGRIPVVGPIFGNNSKSNLRTELVVFLTPRIIDSSEDHEATIQYFQQRLENVFLLMEEE